jgi:hypothetical protein
MTFLMEGQKPSIKVLTCDVDSCLLCIRVRTANKLRHSATALSLGQRFALPIFTSTGERIEGLGTVAT